MPVFPYWFFREKMESKLDLLIQHDWSGCCICVKIREPPENSLLLLMEPKCVFLGPQAWVKTVKPRTFSDWVNVLPSHLISLVVVHLGSADTTVKERWSRWNLLQRKDQSSSRPCVGGRAQAWLSRALVASPVCQLCCIINPPTPTPVSFSLILSSPASAGCQWAGFQQLYFLLGT